MLRTPEQVTGLIARVAAMLGITVILALLYFGRDILVPITLAIILSLLITPSIRFFRRLGLGHTGSIGVAVILTALAFLSICGVIGLQLLRIGESLPQYADTFRIKLATLDHLTLGKVAALTNQAQRFLADFDANPLHSTDAGTGAASVIGHGVGRPVTVELHAPSMSPTDVIIRVVSFMWHPLESAGIVLVVLVFVLFEHEALRDRFIRLAGRDDLRGTTIAVNDAGERLSRFFISTVLVNLSVGCVIGIVLFALGISEAFLWGALAAILRFVPYIGVWIAACCATLLAAVITPGFMLASMTLATFFVIEIFFSQVVEPRLYGHTTGLSPLSIVVAAIFWSWLWGPVGLVLSTPLTLCLVVSGRYFRAFNMFEILLGEIPALTMPQNFYQRALSGDVQEILLAARAWLRTRSFAAYCDSVLIPALHLARQDMDAKKISSAEQERVSSSIVTIIEGLQGNPRWWRHIPRVSVLHGITAGKRLREQREKANEQIVVEPVSPGSIVLCVGAGGTGDELAAEILVRILEKQGIEGRHVVPEAIDAFLSDASKTGKIAVCCVASIKPIVEHDVVVSILSKVNAVVPDTKLIALLIASPFEELMLTDYTLPHHCEILASLETTIQHCLQQLHAFET